MLRVLGLGSRFGEGFEAYRVLGLGSRFGEGFEACRV